MINYLEGLYQKYHHRSFVHPDPLEFLYNYESPPDIEIAGLIASSLAYGRVAQILKSVTGILSPMGSSPSLFIKESKEEKIRSLYKNFKHRFTTGEEMVNFIYIIKNIINEFGSLQECFMQGYKSEDDNILSPLLVFSARLRGIKDKNGFITAPLIKNDNPDEKIIKSTLIPQPQGKSAFKRLNLFLRWMVRKDQVDPGGWDKISTSQLIIPLDTHMYQIALKLNLTQRKSADMTTALEITEAFKKINPQDPVKYDFSLTRPGILNEE